MGKFCAKCGKIMKNSKLSHCSDECILEDIKNTRSVEEFKGAESWDEKTDPWK
jgi:hypothetical protein